jgi:hypothetical protein
MRRTYDKFIVNLLKTNGRYKNLPLEIRGIEGVTAIFSS